MSEAGALGGGATAVDELNRLRALFDSIEDGLAVSEMVYGADGEIVDMVYRQVNRAYERQGGVGDVVGRSKFDVLPGVEDHWLDCFEHVARTGKPIRIENYQQDVDRWFDVYFTRVDDSGRFVAVVFKDITRRTRSDDSLRKAEERNRFLLKVGDAIRMESTPGGKIEIAARLLGERLEASRVL